jgi:Thoeris protein ThsA, Macro domain
MDFIKVFLKLRYPVMLLVAGVLMILLAQYTLAGAWNSVRIRERSSTSVVYLLMGLGLVLASLLVHVVEHEDVTLWAGCKLVKTGTGFKVAYKDSELHVDFGVLQDLYSPSDGSVVVLPANEFFDDCCFNDMGTAAGAFIRTHFSADQAGILKSLVEQKLDDSPFKLIRRRDQEEARSYGTGTCIYLEPPFGTVRRIILGAVATDRPDTGLHTEMVSIFQVMAEVHRIVASERAISVIYIPLLGAGKGGVPAQLALRALTIAALEARCAAGGHAIKEIHLVVYKRDGGEPQISARLARRTVKELVTLYQKVLR